MLSSYRFIILKSGKLTLFFLTFTHLLFFLLRFVKIILHLHAPRDRPKLQGCSSDFGVSVSFKMVMREQLEATKKKEVLCLIAQSIKTC